MLLPVFADSATIPASWPNSNDRIIGCDIVPGVGNRAFVYAAGSMADLNALLGPGTHVPSDLVLTAAAHPI